MQLLLTAQPVLKIALEVVRQMQSDAVKGLSRFDQRSLAWNLRVFRIAGMGLSLKLHEI